jgi:hypothetical protein
MNNNETNDVLPDFDDFIIDLPENENTEIEETVNTDTPVDESNQSEVEQEYQEESESEEENTTVESDAEAIATFRSLVDKGILPDDDEFDGTWEALDERMDNLPTIVAESLIANAPAPFRKVLEYAYLKPDVTEKDLAEFASLILKESNPEEFDYSNIDNVKEFLLESYKEQGLSPKVASAAVRALEDEDFDGEALINEAKTIYEQRKAYSQSDAVIEEQKQQIEKQKEYQQMFVQQVSNELQSTGWAENRVRLVEQQLRENKVTAVLQHALQNPKALVQLANLTTYYDPSKNQFIFDDFVKQQVTKEVEKQKQNIVRDNWRNITGGASVNPKIQNSQKDNLRLEPVLD